MKLMLTCLLLLIVMILVGMMGFLAHKKFDDE